MDNDVKLGRFISLILRHKPITNPIVDTVIVAKTFPNNSENCVMPTNINNRKPTIPTIHNHDLFPYSINKRSMSNTLSLLSKKPSGYT